MDSVSSSKRTRSASFDGDEFGPEALERMDLEETLFCASMVFYVPVLVKECELTLPTGIIITNSTENRMTFSNQTEYSTIEFIFTGQTKSELREYDIGTNYAMVGIVLNGNGNSDRATSYRVGCPGNALERIKRGVENLHRFCTCCASFVYDEAKREFRVVERGMSYFITIDADDCWITLTDWLCSDKVRVSYALNWIVSALIKQPFYMECHKKSQAKLVAVVPDVPEAKDEEA